MIAERARLVNGAYAISDTLATVLSLALAYTLRGVIPGESIPFFSPALPPFAWYLPVLACSWSCGRWCSMPSASTADKGGR